MRLKTISILIILVIFPRLVSSQSFVVDTFHSREIRIDPEEAYGAEISDLATGVECIPLETTSESYFGQVDRLEVVRDTLIIYDEETDAILIFNRIGKFVNKINTIPQIKVIKGKRTLKSFSIDRINHLIIIQVMTTDHQRKLAFFNITGNYVKLEDVRKDDPIAQFNCFYALGNRTYAFANALFSVPKDLQQQEEDRKYELLLGQLPRAIYGRALPFNFDREITGDDYLSGNFYGVNDTAAFYIKSYQYNVYRITSDSVRRAYNFVFPYMLTLPEEFFSDKQLDGKRDAYLVNNSKYIFTIENFYECGKSLTFSLVSKVSLPNVGAHFLYSLTTGSLYSLTNVSPDSLNAYLPLFADHSIVQAADNGCLYTSLSSARLLAEKESRPPEKVKRLPTTLKTFFSKGTANNNPIIVKIKMKAGI